MKKYIKEFFSNEDGLETIEYLIIAAVVAILIGILVVIAGRLKTTAGKAQKDIEDNLNEMDAWLDAN